MATKLNEPLGKKEGVAFIALLYIGALLGASYYGLTQGNWKATLYVIAFVIAVQPLKKWLLKKKEELKQEADN